MVFPVREMRVSTHRWFVLNIPCVRMAYLRTAENVAVPLEKDGITHKQKPCLFKGIATQAVLTVMRSAAKAHRSKSKYVSGKGSSASVKCHHSQS